ncbi:MAG TPA: type II toxin-antitoxin system prevent-host-death family antitoxin [Kofleriaceae bacterium]|jgi:prevent-host-death family protein|nr:type II toxin-antitoxin system prevent-host-death family antitoxin [Kofleriaceae bacterium]
MDKGVSVHEAKTHLSRLLARVASGETIVIAKAGKPIARLVPITRPSQPRVPGNEDVRIKPDFDQLPRNLRRALGMK